MHDLCKVNKILLRSGYRVFVFFNTRTTGQILVKFGIGGSVMNHIAVSFVHIGHLKLKSNFQC
jgi:hypothetical protein